MKNTNKNLWFLAIVVLLTVGVVIVNGCIEGEKGIEYSTYNGDKSTFNYPADWKDVNPSEYGMSQLPDTKFIIKMQKDKHASIVFESIEIERIPINETQLDLYVDDIKQGYGITGSGEFIVLDKRIVNEDEAIIEGKAGEGNAWIHFKVKILNCDCNKFNSLSFYSDEDKLNNYESIALHTIDSFKCVKSRYFYVKTIPENAIINEKVDVDIREGNGKFVDGSEVWIGNIPGGMDKSEIVTSSAGFSFEPDRVGEFLLRITNEKEGYCEYTQIIEVKHNFTIEGPISVNHPNNPIAGDEFRIQVYNENKKPVSDAFIVINGPEYVMAWTNNAGVAIFNLNKTGDYVVKIVKNAPPFWTVNKTLHVSGKPGELKPDDPETFKILDINYPSLNPADTTEITLILKNVGSADSSDVTVTLGFTIADISKMPSNLIGQLAAEYPFVVVGSSGKYIQNFEVGESKELEFKLRIDNDAKTRSYEIPLNIEYYNTEGVKQKVVKTIDIEIKGK